jgi:hypothetical protein
MAKRIILIAVLILGCSVYTFQNQSKATVLNDSASGSGSVNKASNHRNNPPYRIINSRYVSRSSIRHALDHTNGVRLRIMQNGMDNTEIEDFSLAHDSGVKYQMGNVIGIDNSSLPLYVKVTYRSWNTFHAVQFDVIYEFVIFYPGTWDVTINN